MGTNWIYQRSPHRPPKIDLHDNTIAFGAVLSVRLFDLAVIYYCILLFLNLRKQIVAPTDKVDGCPRVKDISFETARARFVRRKLVARNTRY